MPVTILLEGIVGSTAYGLATPDSDIDTLGMFAYDTRAFWGLSVPKATRSNPQGSKPDWTMHEAGKYCSLALSCNPTCLELFWLPRYTVTTLIGWALVEARKAFLHERGVRNAYLGYASQQFNRIRSRGDNSFSSDTRNRTAKHARHLWRLACQGTQLHLTGDMRLRLSAEEITECREFGYRVAGARLDVAERHLAWAESEFNKPGVLPEQPDQERIEDWLYRLRESMLHAEHVR